MLPDSWQRKLLGHIGSVKSGSTPARSQHGRYFLNGKWPWVKTMDLTNAEIATTDELITDAALAESSCKLFPPGTLLVAMYGGFKQIGRTGLLRRESAVNQAISAIELDRSQAHPEFVLHWLNGNVGAWKVFAASSRKDPNITRENVCDFPVNLPTLWEQRRIAQILSTWDQAIATSERLLTNSRKQWNALLGITLHLPSAHSDASAPSDNGGFPASVQPGIPTLPPTPAGWRRVQLCDHLKEVRRPVALKDDESYALVTVKRSRGGVVLREVLRGNEVKTPTQFHVRTGDFLISKRQIVHGACGIVPPELDGAVVSNEYAVLNTDGEIDLKFLRYLSETRYFQQTCFHSSIGVHVEKMIFKTDHWLNWPFNIPPLEQQRRIVEIMDTASRDVASIAEQLMVLKREKSALMAQLLTGKRRVKLPDAEAEAQA